MGYSQKTKKTRSMFHGKIAKTPAGFHPQIQVIRLSPGAMPVTSNSMSAWYLCPLVVCWAEAFGSDLVERPAAWWQPEIEDEDDWLVVWNIFSIYIYIYMYVYICIYILGISSSQLTFIYFRGVAQSPTRDE